MGFFKSLFDYATLPGLINQAVNPKRAPEQDRAAGYLQNEPNWAGPIAGMGGQQGGPGAMIEDLYKNWQGKLSGMSEHMDLLGPGIAASMGGTGAFKDIQDYKARAAAPMGQYGQAAGQIGAGATQAQRQGMEQLGRSGLGGSSQRAALAGQTQLGAGGQKSQAYQQLFQKATQNRQSMAQSAMDSHRMLASLALGHNPAPRTVHHQGGGDNMLGPILGAVGGAAGTFFGGPAGGMGGYAAGNAAGNAIG